MILLAIVQESNIEKLHWHGFKLDGEFHQMAEEAQPLADVTRSGVYSMTTDLLRSGVKVSLCRSLSFSVV